MSLEDLRFVHPEMLALAALLLPLAGLFVATQVARRRAVAGFTGSSARLVSTSGRLQSSRAVLTLVAAAGVVVALAGPYVEERTVEVTWKGVDLVVALDVSQSMGTQDVKPDRLRVARGAIQSLVEQLPGSRVALVLFGASGVVRYPATTDPAVIARSLDSIGRQYRPAAGSSLRAGVDTALSAFPQQTPLPKAILLLTDGEDLTTNEVDVDRLRAGNVRVFALAVGTAQGGQVPAYDNAGRSLGPLLGANGQPVVSKMREDLLRRVTDATGGRQWAYDGSGDGTVRDLAGALQTMGSGELGGVRQKEPDDRYQLFAGGALLALLLGWALSDRQRMPRPGRARIRSGKRSALVATLLAMALASCADPSATNETANGLFASGDVAGALERYKAILREHPDLAEVSVNAGNAEYRLGQFGRSLSNYDAALAAPERTVRATALYDKGDALFRLGRFEDARAAYVEALRLDPNDRDAKFNIEVIDRLRPNAQRGNQPGASPQPGQGQPGGSPQPGQSGAPNGPPNSTTPAPPGQQGDPQSGQPGDGQESVQQALQDFRQNLTPEEALRLLDALLRQQKGLDTLLDNGQRRPGQEPQY